MPSPDLSRRGLLALGASGVFGAIGGAVLGEPSQAGAAVHRPPVQHAVADVYRRGNKNRKAVSLSFDAGADVGYAAQILDLLGSKSVRASFGMTGRWVEQNPTVAKRVIDEGHHLINHSMSHRSFTYGAPGRRPLTRAQRWQQLDDAEAIYQRVLGVGSNGWFRPPYMAWDLSCSWDCADHGWNKIAMQTVDSGGWKGGPWQVVRYRCTRLAMNGAIYVFHVGRGSTDMRALPDIIDALRQAGYSFETVADIVRP